ncbi:hypothetical protein [Streptomyces sp. NPDC055749]
MPLSRSSKAAVEEEARATLAHMLMSRSEPQGVALGPEAWTPVAVLHPTLPGQSSRSHGRGSWGEFLGTLVETGHSATLLGKDSTNAVAAYLGFTERAAKQGSSDQAR